jgi:hypothetical protein
MSLAASYVVYRSGDGAVAALKLLLRFVFRREEELAPAGGP